MNHHLIVPSVLPADFSQLGDEADGVTTLRTIADRSTPARRDEVA